MLCVRAGLAPALNPLPWAESQRGQQGRGGSAPFSHLGTGFHPRNSQGSVVLCFLQILGFGRGVEAESNVNRKLATSWTLRVLGLPLGEQIQQQWKGSGTNFRDEKGKRGMGKGWELQSAALTEAGLLNSSLYVCVWC